jgi:hypothetical protein
MALKKVILSETSDDQTENVITVKLGTIGNPLTDADRGKPVKLIGDAQFDLCATGDQIEGYVASIANFTADGLTVGSVRYVEPGNKKEATIAVAGWAIGNYVLADAQAARGTYNDVNQFPRPKVKLTADQQAATIAALLFRHRIVGVMPGFNVGDANAVVIIMRA